ncbi:MAG: hypothetical protein QG650_168 [Patescibacteria group bacterium]|nr:hypothetical protein [Patescibacteria group bacterium]
MPLREEIRSEKNRRRTLAAGVFITIAAIGSYAAFFRPTEETAEFKTAEVTLANVTETVSANGKAAYRGYYDLAFPRGGRIAFVADEGKTVGRGDTVAALDGTFEKIAVEKARIAVEAAGADVRSKKESSASEEEIRLYETRLRSAESDLESAKRARERAISEAQKSFETARTELRKSEESVRTAEIELERTIMENARGISEWENR